MVPTTMSEKNWICPCNGCKKARRQAFEEIEELMEKWKPDVHLAYHEIFMKINGELHPPKKEKK